MLAIFLLNPRGYHHFRLTMQRYENFMTPPNFKGSEFTLLKGKISDFSISVVNRAKHINVFIYYYNIIKILLILFYSIC